MELKATKYDVDGGIATITLCRPQRLNAWTGRMHTEYRQLLDQANKDDAVRAILLTGEGRGFCVGGDIQALEGHAEKGGYDPGTPARLAEPGFGVREEFDASFAYHFGLAKPIIAAINGPAAGVGLTLALFADLRFAVPGAKFTAAHGRLNFPAEFGISWLLPRMIGLPRANDLLLSCRIFTSDEAHELGLIKELVPPEELIPRTRAYLLEMIGRVSPGSLRETRWQVYADLHQDVATAVRKSEALTDFMSRQPDYKEGVRAFIERRQPNWQGS